MRILIDLSRTEDDRVEGVVSTEGSDVAVSFSGWLELLALLEAMGIAGESDSPSIKRESGWVRGATAGAEPPPNKEDERENEMNTMTRRKLLQAGAAGTAMAGIAAATRVAPAGAEAATVGGIHIHGSLKQTGGPPLLVIGRLIDINVLGPDDDLSGCGWDADPETAGGSLPKDHDVSQCFYSQRGSVQGDVVKLKGRILFAGFPGEIGHVVTTEANLATGQVKWSDGEGDHAFVFEGTGVVTRI